MVARVYGGGGRRDLFCACSGGGFLFDVRKLHDDGEEFYVGGDRGGLTVVIFRLTLDESAHVRWCNERCFKSFYIIVGLL